MKLNGSVVQDVSLHAQSQFGRGGSIFKGLLKMVKDYRFDWSYTIMLPRVSFVPTVCRTLYCASCSLCRTPLHDWSVAHDVVITSCRYYMNSIGSKSENVSSSKSHVWFASRCLGRRLSTWKMTAASCPMARGGLCGQLTFRLAWCHKHSAVTATELVQPLDLPSGTLFRSSCAIQTYL